MNTDVVSKKIIIKWNSIPEKKWMLFLGLIVFFANIHIYMVNTLIQDDNGVYYLWNKGGFSLHWKFGFAYINLLLTWIASKIDFYLARSIVLVGVLIPTILLLFRLLRKFGYPLPVALFSAGLTGFFPGQLDIPIFVNGSYHADALLVMLIAFFVAIKFIEDSDKYRWGWYLFATSTLYCALIMSELIVPTAIAFVFGFLCWRHFEKKACLLSASFALLTLYHTYFGIIHNDKAKDAVKQGASLTFEGFLKVFQKFIAWGFPTIYTPKIDVYLWEIFITIICAVCLVIGIVQGFSPETEPSITKRRFARRWAYIWRVIFPVILCLSTLVVMTAAPWFRPRHALFPAVGLYLLMSFSLYEVFKKYKYGKPFILIILMWLTTGSILQHYKNTDNAYSYLNKIHEDFMNFANTVKYPLDAQIVVVNMDPQTNGYWRWSTGYLQSSLSRKDISGLIGNELKLIDPFTPEKFSKGGMNGLVLDKPLFLYRKTDNGFTRLTHFLQWKENSIESQFIIFQTDPIIGKITPIINGRGWAAYESAVHSLSKQGINRSDIMWGGEPGKIDKERLGLPELWSSQNKYNFHVSDGTFEKGGIGFVLSSDADNNTARALKNTELVYKNIIKIKGQMKAGVPSGTRNGFIVFGENPGQMVKAGVLIGANTLVIQGPYIEEVKKPQQFDQGKVLDTELIINLSENTVSWKVDDTEVKTRMKTRPSSINYVGFSVWNTKTEFSELKISGN